MTELHLVESSTARPFRGSGELETERPSYKAAVRLTIPAKMRQSFSVSSFWPRRSELRVGGQGDVRPTLPPPGTGPRENHSPGTSPSAPGPRASARESVQVSMEKDGERAMWTDVEQGDVRQTLVWKMSALFSFCSFSSCLRLLSPIIASPFSETGGCSRTPFVITP